MVLSKYTNGQIHCFDAEEQNVIAMEKTLKMNCLERVIPVHSALSDFIGTIDLVTSGNGISSGNTVNSTMEKHFQSAVKVTVPCTTIDTYVKEHQIQVGLIKTDVEGAEQPLLRGAIETIRAQKPTLSISIYHTMDDFMQIKPWVESLNLGYEFKISRPIIKGSFSNETVLLCEVPPVSP